MKKIIVGLLLFLLGGCGSGSGTTGTVNQYAASFAGYYYGSSQSDVYHYPSCPSAQQISPSNLISFATADLAVTKGYRPCLVCQPPQGTTQNYAPTVNVTNIPATLSLNQSNLSSGKYQVRYYVSMADVNGSIRDITYNVYDPSNNVTDSYKTNLNFTGYQTVTMSEYATISTSIAGKHTIETIVTDPTGLSTTVKSYITVQ